MDHKAGIEIEGEEDLIEGTPNHTKMRGREPLVCPPRLLPGLAVRERHRRALYISRNTRHVPPAWCLAQLIDKHITSFSAPLYLACGHGRNEGTEMGWCAEESAVTQHKGAQFPRGY